MSEVLRDSLRRMVAVLQDERQALAGLDLDGIVAATADKQALCGRIEQDARPQLDDECRGLLDTARRLNEVNRQVRNLLAASVAARLDALTGAVPVYRSPAFAGIRA